jgi:hypothetical protein
MKLNLNRHRQREKDLSLCFDVNCVASTVTPGQWSFDFLRDYNQLSLACKMSLSVAQAQSFVML